jgi:hypothetical protein
MPPSDGRVPAIPQNHIRESPGPERGVFPRGVAATGIDGHFEQTLILVAERDSTFDASAGEFISKNCQGLDADL